MDDWIKVARLEDLPPGGWKSVETPDATVALFNLDGTVYALEDVCTHDGERLTGGHYEAGEVACPRHGARFCVKTGAALTAPAYEPTASFPVRIVDGDVLIRDNRWD